LDAVVRQDDGIEIWNGLLQPVANPTKTKSFAIKLISFKLTIKYLHNSIVVEKQTFQSWQIGKVVQLAKLIVRKINRVKLIQSGSQIFNQRYFIP